MNDYIIIGLSALILVAVLTMSVRQGAAIARLEGALSRTLAAHEGVALQSQDLSESARRLSEVAGSVQEIGPRLESRMSGVTSLLDGLKSPIVALSDRLVPSEPDVHWITAAPAGIGGLATLESGLARHPGSRALFQAVRTALVEAGDATPDLALKRDVVIRLRRHAQLFMQHCAPRDFEFGAQVKDEADGLADRLVETILRKQRDGLDRSIQELAERARQLMQQPRLSASEQDEIARLDQRVDKAAMASFQDLKAKYDAVSAEVVQYFQEGERASVAEKTLRYNRQALSDACQAQAKFDEWQDPVVFKDDPPVAAFAELLGGWDARFLLPPVSAYTGSVFAEIFQKLSREQRKALTQRMVDQASRPVE